MPRRGMNWRRVKRHRSYSVGEAAQVVGVSKLTVRRWVKGDLPALTEKRPWLILGNDLAEFLQRRAKSKTRLRLDEFFCFRCRRPRPAAAGMADYVPRNARSGMLIGLCAECQTVMRKAFSVARLREVAPKLDVSFPQGEPHLNDTIQPLLNDHFGQEPIR